MISLNLKDKRAQITLLKMKYRGFYSKTHKVPLIKINISWNGGLHGFIRHRHKYLFARSICYYCDFKSRFPVCSFDYTHGFYEDLLPNTFIRFCLGFDRI